MSSCMYLFDPPKFSAAKRGNPKKSSTKYNTHTGRKNKMYIYNIHYDHSFASCQIAMLGCKCVRAHVHHVFGHNHIFGCFEIRDLDSANCFIVKPTPNNHRPAAHLIVLRPSRFDFPGFSVRKLEKIYCFTNLKVWPLGNDATAGETFSTLMRDGSGHLTSIKLK